VANDLSVEVTRPTSDAARRSERRLIPLAAPLVAAAAPRMAQKLKLIQRTPQGAPRPQASRKAPPQPWAAASMCKDKRGVFGGHNGDDG